MKYVSLFLFLFMYAFSLHAVDMSMLYNRNLAKPETEYEKQLVEHVKNSLESALKGQSKLNKLSYNNVWKEVITPYHFLNNVCALKGSSHLHVGLLKGISFIAALYGNQDLISHQIGLDWFQEASEEEFYANLGKYIDLYSIQILNGDCFKMDKSKLPPIDIYFYDADHSLKGHEKSITYYDSVFAKTFIAIIDDWKCPWVRRPTFKAFDKLGYKILYEAIIPEINGNGSEWNVSHGQYLAVIRRSTK